MKNFLGAMKAFIRRVKWQTGIFKPADPRKKAIADWNAAVEARRAAKGKK